MTVKLTTLLSIRKDCIQIHVDDEWPDDTYFYSNPQQKRIKLNYDNITHNEYHHEFSTLWNQKQEQNKHARYEGYKIHSAKKVITIKVNDEWSMIMGKITYILCTMECDVLKQYKRIQKKQIESIKQNNPSITASDIELFHQFQKQTEAYGNDILYALNVCKLNIISDDHRITDTFKDCLFITDDISTFECYNDSDTKTVTVRMNINQNEEQPLRDIGDYMNEKLKGRDHDNEANILHVRVSTEAANVMNQLKRSIKMSSRIENMKMDALLCVKKPSSYLRAKSWATIISTTLSRINKNGYINVHDCDVTRSFRSFAPLNSYFEYGTTHNIRGIVYISYVPKLILKSWIREDLNRIIALVRQSHATIPNKNGALKYGQAIPTTEETKFEAFFNELCDKQLMENFKDDVSRRDDIDGMNNEIEKLQKVAEEANSCMQILKTRVTTLMEDIKDENEYWHCTNCKNVNYSGNRCKCCADSRDQQSIFTITDKNATENQLLFDNVFNEGQSNRNKQEFNQYDSYLFGEKRNHERTGYFYQRYLANVGKKIDNEINRLNENIESLKLENKQLEQDTMKKLKQSQDVSQRLALSNNDLNQTLNETRKKMKKVQTEYHDIEECNKKLQIDLAKALKEMDVLQQTITNMTNNEFGYKKTIKILQAQNNEFKKLYKKLMQSMGAIWNE